MGQQRQISDHHDMADDIEHFRGYGWDDRKIENRLGLRRGAIKSRERARRLNHAAREQPLSLPTAG